MESPFYYSEVILQFCTPGLQWGNMSNLEPYLTLIEVAKILRMHPVTIRRKAERKEIPGSKLFGRWLFRPSKINELFRNAQ